MNIKNALGFFVLGLLMNATPVVAQSLTGTAFLAESSVRQVWLEFMSWVVGGIGFAYVAREGAVRVSVALAAVIPVRLFRPIDVQVDVPMRTAVRVGATY